MHAIYNTTQTATRTIIGSLVLPGNGQLKLMNGASLTLNGKETPTTNGAWRCKDSSEFSTTCSDNFLMKTGAGWVPADTAPCYAELFTTHIFYHKAMMYGSNLFTGWIYRDFDGDTQTKVGKGQVKNPLEYFPPKTEDIIDEAKLELRDAYSKNFPEYVEKKVFKVKRQRR